MHLCHDVPPFLHENCAEAFDRAQRVFFLIPYHILSDKWIFEAFQDLKPVFKQMQVLSMHCVVVLFEKAVDFRFYIHILAQ